MAPAVFTSKRGVGERTNHWLPSATCRPGATNKMSRDSAVEASKIACGALVLRVKTVPTINLGQL